MIDQNPIPSWKYYLIEQASQLNFCNLLQINQIDSTYEKKNLKKTFFQSLLLNY